MEVFLQEKTLIFSQLVKVRQYIQVRLVDLGILWNKGLFCVRNRP